MTTGKRSGWVPVASASSQSSCELFSMLAETIIPSVAIRSFPNQKSSVDRSLRLLLTNTQQHTALGWRQAIWWTTGLHLTIWGGQFNMQRDDTRAECSCNCEVSPDAMAGTDNNHGLQGRQLLGRVSSLPGWRGKPICLVLRLTISLSTLQKTKRWRRQDKPYTLLSTPILLLSGLQNFLQFGIYTKQTTSKKPFSLPLYRTYSTSQVLTRVKKIA